MATKFTTVRNLMIGGVVLLGGASLLFEQANTKDPYEELYGQGHFANDGHNHGALPPKETAAEAKAREAEARAKRALGEAKRNADPHSDPVLGGILKRIEEPLSGSKLKDAFKGFTYKVDLYGSGGKVESLKIDFDRDNLWDEKWTLKTPGVLEGLKREISSADDASYDKALFYRGGAFKPADEGDL